jgi:transcriptional regulator with XRE-family HTH domain
MKRLNAMQHFIANMIRIRKDRGMTQTDLADLIGTKQSAISRLERGEEDITLTRAEAIADALSVELSEMVTSAELSKIT